jgi:gluconate 2-dehydrogenase gamma chain
MPTPTLDRRALLKLGGGLWAASALSLPLAAIARNATMQRDDGAFAHLDAALAATLEAVTARILPTTDTPGAREAGAIWFIDAALATDLGDALPLLQAGAAELDAVSGGDFSALAPAAQDVRLRAIEDGEFFGLMHFLTLAGTFTMSAYGGNRGEIGWDLLGFDRRHHWDPPFGHYDRGHHGEAEA